MHPAIRLIGLIAALGWVVPMGPAMAQPYPAKLVKLVVPQTPGGATDVFARKIGQILSERWGQPVVIENRAGAGGVVGTDVVAKAPPDGYTLLVTYAGSQAINASLYPKLPFDTIKDFQTVATIASTPFILIVNPKLPAKDFAEFIALAKAKPGTLTYASSGNGSVNHLIGEMVKSETGISMLHVPYRGVAPATTSPPHRRFQPLPNPASRASTSIPGGEFWHRRESTWRLCARSTVMWPALCVPRR
jgi:tripartite-type tricarboxylate transporter receptor subunit TctC